MILFIDGNGNQIKTIPDNVYQGSNEANEIVVIAPLSSTLIASISFRLPTGVILGQRIITDTSWNMTLTELVNNEDKQLNCWRFKIPASLTEYYGNVDYQIRFKNGAGQVITTCSSSFKVQRGVAPIIDLTDDDTSVTFEDLEEVVAQVQADLINGFNLACGLKPYNSEYPYIENDCVITYNDNIIRFYKSISGTSSEPNLNNPLTDDTKWQFVSDFVTPSQVSSSISSAINLHNTNSLAHTDIQNLLKGYADNKDAITLQSAKNYTDEKDAITLQSAKNYADNQDIQTLNNAKSYTNSKYADATTYADNKIINAYSTAQNKSYSANYQNKNFAPISYVSNLYATKLLTSAMVLSTEAPNLNDNNIYEVTNSINTEYDWNTPEFTMTRSLSTPTTIASNNSFEVNIKFQVSRDCQLSFGGYIEVSTDNGTTWTKISNNFTTSDNEWNTGVGNTVDFTIQTDEIENEITYPRNTLLRISIFKKQYHSSNLTTTYYFGVLVDNAPIYSFVKFNFTNVYINTSQIANNSITEIKLDANLRNKINNATKPNVETFTLSTNDWIQLSGQEPFTYYTEKTITSTITEHTIVELINDNPIEFYNNGYAILSVSGQVAVIGCITLPVDPIQVKIMTYDTNEVQASLLTPEISVDNLNVLTITNFSMYDNSTQFNIYATKSIPEATSNFITSIYKEYDGDTLDLTPYLQYAGQYGITCIAVDNGVVSASSEEESAIINSGLYYWYWDEDNDEEVLTFVKSWADMVSDGDITLNSEDDTDVIGASWSGYQANRLLIDSSILTITNMRNTDVNEIYIPCEVTEIGNQAFQGCTAQNVYIEDFGQQVYFGTNVFEQSNLQVVPMLPQSNSIIPQGFMYLCGSVTSLNLWYDNIIQINTNAFSNITISQDGSPEIWLQYVKVIRQYAFDYVSGITDVYLTTEIERIGQNAFGNMGSITIHYSGTQAQWNEVYKDIGWDTNTTITMSYEDDGYGGE